MRMCVRWCWSLRALPGIVWLGGAGSFGWVDAGIIKRNRMSEDTGVRKPKFGEKGRLMSASEIERTLVRLAHEIVEKHGGSKNVGLVGIKRRGVPLAQRLGKLIEKIEKHPVDVGV